MFGPSPGPPSPGPDADFYASIYGHQVPAEFRQGARPQTVVRDQIGTRDITRQLPRKTPAPCLCSIAEARPRPPPTAQPQAKRAGRAAPSRRPPPPARDSAPTEADRKASAQRMVEARKHYQKMGRASAGEQRAAPCAGAAPSAKPGIAPEEAQRRARERVRDRKKQEAGPPMRAQRPPPVAQPPPGPAQFTGFIPPQVQRMMPPPPPPPARTAGRAGKRPSDTRGTQLPTTRRPGCCGGRRADSAGPPGSSGQGGCCGGRDQGKDCPKSRQQGTSTQGDQRPQTAPSSSGEGPRRVVQRTSSLKRIVTKQKR